MPLLVATGNAGKLQEFRRQLDGIDIVSPGDLGLIVDVEETGSTFEANALLKAQAYAAASGLTALADDSGLEVDALNGEPGVYSARYGGPDLNDGQRCDLILERLRAHSAPAERNARFRCALVAMAPDGRQCQADGICDGRIAPAPSGSAGFGYDPIFFLPGLGRTAAQLAAGQKDAISHRGRALRAIYPLLTRTFQELRS